MAKSTRRQDEVNPVFLLAIQADKMSLAVLSARDFLCPAVLKVIFSLWAYYNRPFARWHYFATKSRILQGFAFLCKHLNLTGMTKFKLI